MSDSKNNFIYFISISFLAIHFYNFQSFNFIVFYLYIFDQGYYAPLVELHMEYKRPLRYKDSARVEIVYRHTDAAKLIFDYKIYHLPSDDIVATGYSVQVFLDRDFNLMWDLPPFFAQWQQKYIAEV